MRSSINFLIHFHFLFFLSFSLSQAHSFKRSAFQSLHQLLKSYHFNYFWDKKKDIIILKCPGKDKKITFLPYNNFFWVGSTVHFVKNHFHYDRGEFMIPTSITSIIEKFYQKDPSLFKKRMTKKLTLKKNSPLSSVKKPFLSHFFSIPTIVIDPGHGGKDYGAIGHNVNEKDLNLKIALALKRHLTEAGFHVKLTRETDQFIGLQQRTVIANTRKTDLFISIHSNSSLHKEAHGLEIYFLSHRYNNHQRASRVTPFMMKNFFSFSPPQQDAPHTFQILSELVLNHNRDLSKILGTMILKKIIKETKQLNRGVKTAQFYVLKHTNSPSILIEVGFLSHYRESQLLKKKFPMIAESIFQGILLYTKKYFPKKIKNEKK